MPPPDIGAPAAMRFIWLSLKRAGAAKARQGAAPRARKASIIIFFIIVPPFRERSTTAGEVPSHRISPAWRRRKILLEFEGTAYLDDGRTSLDLGRASQRERFDIHHGPTLRVDHKAD